MVHAFLVFNVAHALWVNGRVLHFIRFSGSNQRFVSVTIDTELNVFIVNESTINSRSTAVVFVSLDFLEFIPRRFLCGEKRHLFIGPAVVAPLSAVLVCVFNLVIARKLGAVCCTHRFCIRRGTCRMKASSAS